MTTNRQHLECMEASLRVPTEVWSTTSGNGCNDVDAVTQNKDCLNNSYPVDDSWAYDPDFETWDEGDLVDETTLDNSFASHQTDELGENHSYSGRSQPHTEAHSPTSMVSKSTVESRISYTSSHDSASQPDPQALQYEQLSSNSSTVIQSSRGDSWATVTPISCSSTPLKVNSNCERHPRIDMKHSEVDPKRRGSHCTCEGLSDPGNEVQNCSDEEFSNDDHCDSEEDSLDYRFNTNLRAPAEASHGAKTEPRSKFCRTFDSSKVSSGDSNLDPVAKCHSDDHPVISGAVQMDLSSTQVSSDQSSVITGLETGDAADKQLQTDADLMWMDSTGKMMENEIKHSTFDLALVLSQPPLSVLTPPFNPEDFENYTQVSQSMLKEKIIRLAALLQACRDLIAWNKEERQQLLAEKDTLRNENARDLKQLKQEILNRVQEIKNREAEIEGLKQALAEETREKVSNADEIKRLMDQMKKDNEKSEESLARFLGVAKQLKAELRVVRHELVRKEEETRRELMQKEEEARREVMRSEEEMRDEMVQKEEEMRQELILKEEELREEIREEIREEMREEMREELREEIITKEKETRFGILQNDKGSRHDMILKGNHMKFELIHKEEAVRQEIAQRDKEIEALQMALEKEKQRHLVEEESVQQALTDYKRSVDQKLVDADHQINLKLEELIGQCQRITKAAGKKSRHPKPASTKAVEQKTDPSVAEKTGRATTPLSVMSGRSSAVPPASPVTQSSCGQELASRVNATTDNEAVPNQPRKSPMFSLANTPTIKISLVSSEDSLANAISPKVQQLLDIN